jgi:hypothetical protein
MLGARDVALVNKACDMLLDELVGKYKIEKNIKLVDSR